MDASQGGGTLGFEMSMKWAYVLFAIGGGLSPAVRIYVRFATSPNYTGAQFDPVLLMKGMALSFATIPVFAGVGVLILGVPHLAAVLIRRHRAQRRSRAAGADTSWVSHRGRAGEVGNGPSDTAGVPQDSA